MKPLRAPLAALACAAALAGCAGAGGMFRPAASIQPFREPTTSVQNAADSLAPGKSTQADVLAAFGQGTVVRFDSGYEVWVYREKSARDSEAEFVILFDPQGVVRKTRARR